MSVWDLSSDDGRDTALDLTKTPDLTLCEPQAFSTAMENENKESGYATKPNETTNSPPLDENACVSEEMWNGQGNAELDQTVIDKRPRKLTEKGKGYRLVQRKGERNKLKRKIQSQIANISTLLGHDKNLELISDLSIKLNDLFEQFGDLHEEIQELLTKEEQITDSENYDDLYQEIRLIRETVQKWMIDANQRIRDEKIERGSAKSIKSKGSRSSKLSTTSSRAKALEAKARQAELEARIAQLDQVEAAKKEAERAKLMAERAAVAAVNKVYEDAMKEDDEQYLGSDDPDINDTAADDQPKPKKSSQTTEPIQTIDESRNLRKTEAEIKHLNDPAENQLESISALDPKAPEFALPSVPLQSECVVSNGSAAYCNPMVTNCNAEVTSLVPPAAFWEKMELRMTQPPPVPAPFDGDPSRYLRFRADFRDQVESRASLTDSEKMNYLMTYTKTLKWINRLFNHIIHASGSKITLDE